MACMGKSKPLPVTVVMTLFKRVELFPHALQSLLWQTHQEWELLVLEDGAHPHARQAFRVLVGDNPGLARRARYVECPLPAGAAGPWGHALRRQGLAMAAGEYVCWVSHDNLLHPEYLQLHRENVRPGVPCVSLVPVDYWAGCWYDRRLPPAWGKGVRPAVGDLDLVNMCVPTRAARAVGAFAEPHDALKEAGHLAYEALAAALPVVLNERAVGAAHF